MGGEAAADGKRVSSEAKCSFTPLVCQCPAWEGVVASEGKSPQLLLLPLLRRLLSHAVVGGAVKGRRCGQKDGCIKSWG